MKKKLIEAINESINLHMKAIINYEKMRIVANRDTTYMDHNQKKAHKQELTDIFKKIQKYTHKGDEE